MDPQIKVGIGYDSHRFTPNRPLVLGGVIIPHHKGLAGHSDADVLLHAIADALLGAAGLGDIGTHFPDIDEKYKDIKSTRLLAVVFEKIIKHGFLIGNVDSVIIAETPRINPHIPIMKRKISKILVMTEQNISIKATSNEKMGFIGREEGIAVMATASIYKDDGTISSTDK
ncbi:MAG TPA: 2-C-methyl-D-erythritol 2,4-cyclodiphosphate synthase [candidate division Zixibacteria bacterium]|nr:2-C-methyl-D-erythritol 2,4-cyclodiphosphate synthase [candidate division Zixibacteria bacterium]